MVVHPGAYNELIHCDPEQRQWDEIVRRDGLKAALPWRDSRYDQRLARNAGNNARPAPILEA